MDLNITNTLEYIENMEYATLADNFTTSLEELAIIKQAMDNADISEEGLRDAFKSITTAYKNIFINFNTLLSKARSKYTTEFITWEKKNKSEIAKVEAMSWDAISTIEVDFPTGMTMSYVETLTLINNFFNGFQAGAQLKYISATIDTIISSISKESNAHETSLSVANKTIASTSKKLISNNKALVSSFDFSMVANSKKTVSALFPAKNGLQQARTLLASSNKFIATDVRVLSICKNIEQSLDLCVSYIEDRIDGDEGEYVPSKQFIKDFSDFIGQVDGLFAMYGATIIRTLAIQHNMVFVYDTIYKHAK